MSAPSFWVPEVVLGVVELGPDEAHHAGRVMRLRVGEPVLITDGNGVFGRAAVASTQPFAVAVDSIADVPRPTPRITVVQAIPKGERAELAVELLTEVGADRIIAWESERTVVRWKAERAAKALAKWQSAAFAAAKQSRRAYFPEVIGPLRLQEVLAAAEGAALLVLHEASTEPLSSAAISSSDVVLVVGPEGGISDAELDVLLAAGGKPVRLGDTVLRTSTAGAVAVSILNVRCDRW